LGQLNAPSVEEGAGADEEGVGPLAPKIFEGRIDLPTGVGIQDLDLQPHGARSRLQVSQCRLGNGYIGGVDEHRNANSPGHQLTQEFQPLLLTPK